MKIAFIYGKQPSPADLEPQILGRKNAIKE